MRPSFPWLSRAGATKGFNMWMPNMPMTLVGARQPTANSNASAVFRVLPRMTKWEIKEYLTKIYGLPVKKVNTMNYMGKRKRLFGKRKIVFWKHKDFKKAIVTFDSSLKDLGLGTKIAEMDNQEESEDEQKS